jgi:hypothetical protein
MWVYHEKEFTTSFSVPVPTYTLKKSTQYRVILIPNMTKKKLLAQVEQSQFSLRGSRVLYLGEGNANLVVAVRNKRVVLR